MTQVSSASLELLSAPTITNAVDTAMSRLSVPIAFQTGLESNNGRFSLFPGPSAADQCSAKAVSRSGTVHTATQQVSENDAVWLLP